MNIIEQFLADNPLEEHELVQGTPEWLEFRRNHDGSSEAAAALGLSNTSMRNEMLHAKSSGVEKEFSDYVQKYILNPGHEVEALARPIVEQQFGIKLYPLVCSRGRPSASCDGITMSGTIGWEHKQWNEALADAVRACELPDTHMPQVQQQLLVTGAEKWIFTVSNGTSDKMVSMEVLPDPVWFERILLGWAQFNKDRESYVHIEHAEKPKAEVTIELPALFVHTKGEITEHNMEAFGVALTARLAEVRAIALVTDQDFSNAKEAAKKFRDTAKAIAASKEAMLAQTETIGEAARKMDAWAKDLNSTALQLEKDVEREDLAKKRLIVAEAAAAYAAHVAELEAEIKPIRMSVWQPDFAGEIKGKRNYASMQNAVDTALANGKIAADAQAKDYREKLDWCKKNAAGQGALFPDLQQIIAKPLDDFTLLITSRIDAQKKAEAEKLAAERARMEAAAKEKAEREAAAKIVEAEERGRAEERAKAEAEQKEREKLVSEQAVLSDKVEADAKANRHLDDLEDRMLAEQEAAAKKKTPEGEAGMPAWARPASASQTEYAAPVVKTISSDAQDAERYRWLRERLLGADFDWNGSGVMVLAFEFPRNVGVGGDCDKNIDAAMRATEMKVAA